MTTCRDSGRSSLEWVCVVASRFFHTRFVGVGLKVCVIWPAVACNGRPLQSYDHMSTRCTLPLLTARDVAPPNTLAQEHKPVCTAHCSRLQHSRRRSAANHVLHAREFCVFTLKKIIQSWHVASQEGCNVRNVHLVYSLCERRRVSEIHVYYSPRCTLDSTKELSIAFRYAKVLLSSVAIKEVSDIDKPNEHCWTLRKHHQPFVMRAIQSIEIWRATLLEQLKKIKNSFCSGIKFQKRRKHRFCAVKLTF